MGADQFCVKASGKDAKGAFWRAVEDARYENGHDGYTGTIAEKHEFKMVQPREGESPHDCMERCLDDDAHFCQDKWGPAACVLIGPNARVPGEQWYYFFGWASS